MCEMHFDLKEIRDWLNNDNPDIVQIAHWLEWVRRLARDVRVAEAYLVGYGMDLLGLTDYDEVPEILQPPSEEDV